MAVVGVGGGGGVEVLLVGGWEGGDWGLGRVVGVVEVVAGGARVAGRVGGDAEAGGRLDVGRLRVGDRAGRVGDRLRRGLRRRVGLLGVDGRDGDLVLVVVVCVHRRGFAADGVGQLGRGGDKGWAGLRGKTVVGVSHEVSGGGDSGCVCSRRVSRQRGARVSVTGVVGRRLCGSLGLGRWQNPRKGLSRAYPDRCFRWRRADRGRLAAPGLPFWGVARPGRKAREVPPGALFGHLQGCDLAGVVHGVHDGGAAARAAPAGSR